MLGQGQGGVLFEGKGPQARVGLRGAVDDLAGDLDPLPSDGKLEAVEVDIDPAQAEQFTAAQAGHPDQMPQCIQRITCDAIDLRHTAATLAFWAQADLKYVQERLGHSSPVTTAKIYISVLSDVDSRQAQATARMVLDAAPRRPEPGSSQA